MQNGSKSQCAQAEDHARRLSGADKNILDLMVALNAIESDCLNKYEHANQNRLDLGLNADEAAQPPKTSETCTIIIIIKETHLSSGNRQHTSCKLIL